MPRTPKPSWYGESVGHYEGGDTLVVDTVAQNTETYLDNYNTPHTAALHVVERFRMIDGGKTMTIGITVEDPCAFTTPWTAVQRFARFSGTSGNIGVLFEDVCADAARFDTFNYGTSHMAEIVPLPQADRPDF